MVLLFFLKVKSLFMGLHLHKILGLLSFLILTSFSLQAQIYTMDGSPITDCTGFFMDSGGSGGGYGTNENFTTTICSDASTGTHIQLQFANIDIGAGESFTVYDSDMVDPAAQLDGTFLMFPNNPFTLQATAANTTGCLTIVFTSDGTDEGNLGWSAAIECIPACQIITADLVSTFPEVMPADTGWIDICPGQRVEFTGRGLYPQNGVVYEHSDATCSFEWVFGDGNTAVGPNVTNVFEEPGGYIVQLKLTDQFGCENTNYISQRIRVSTRPTYTFDGTLDTTLCSGDTIDITSSVDTSSTSNVSVFPNQGSFQQTLVVSNPLLLPDGTGAVYEETLSFTQFSPGALLTNPNDILNVTLDIEHSYGGDLDIQLTCPDGSSIFFLDFPSGVGSTNFGEPYATNPVDGQSNDLTLGVPYTYTFTNDAPNGTLVDFDAMAPNYTYTTVPSETTGQQHTYSDSYFPAGEYQPLQPFSDLLGCPLNGDWTITVQDNLGADNGWMTEWSMTFADHLYPNLETFRPVFVDWGWENNPTIISSDQNSVEAVPINAGVAAYTFWVLDDFGCLNDTTLNFEILPDQHPDCYNCDIQVNMPADTAICAGESVDLDVCNTNTLEECVTFERFPQYAVGFGNHPPANAYKSPLVINSLNPTTITNPLEDICSICVDMNTDFLSDINLSLEAPNGAVLALSLANGGGSMAGYQNTCFVPTAMQNIQTGAPPYTGEFQPEGDWSVLMNAPINGEWNLVVSDAFGFLDMGELLHWSITFNNVNEYTYSWTPATDLSCDDCCTPTVTPAATTAYELMVEDIYGCSYLDTITIEVITDLPTPIVSCVPTGQGIEFTWQPMPDVTQWEYNIIINTVEQGWMGPITDTQLLVDMLNSGDEVTLLVRPFFASGGFDCTVPEGSSTCEVVFCTLASQDPTLTHVDCFGDATGAITIPVMNGEAPFTYQISGDPATYTDPNIGNLAAGMYTYTITDDIGCTVSVPFEITEAAELTASATQTFIACFDADNSQAEAVALGGTGDYSYEWSNGDNTVNALDLAPGTASVTVTDENGCMADANVLITELTAVSFTIDFTRPSCDGLNDGTIAAINPSGGVGTTAADYTITWQDGDSNFSRPNISGGLYTATVSDAQGCEAELSQEVENPDAVSFALQAFEPSCFQGNDASAEVINVVGPNGNTYTYQWDAAANSQQTATATGLSAGIYSVTIEDALGCIASNNIEISEPAQMTADFSVKDIECFNYADGSVNVQVQGGTPAYNYNWSGGLTGATIENLVAGDYSVTITDAKGCEVIDQVTITQPATLVASTQVSDVSCFGERDGMIEVLTQGGTPPFQYSVGNNFFIGSSTIIGLEAGEYTVTIKDVNGCEFYTQATVPQPDEISIDAGADTSLVWGEEIILDAAVINAQGATEFVWQEPYEGTLSCLECPTPTASPLYTIDYEVYVIDENGCTDTDMIRVFVEKPKSVEVPTAFTPNGDFINDRLIVHGRTGTQILDFQLYDRWGEMIYQTENFPVNNTSNIGWDGTYRSKDMDPGVYVWYLVALHEDGTEEVFKGQTTLIR